MLNDDFIFKLKTSIETVRSQIDELNEALKDAKFGQDSYQFVVSPSPEYREYYDMITDELLLTYGEDEQLYLEKYQDVNKFEEWLNNYVNFSKK